MTGNLKSAIANPKLEDSAERGDAGDKIFR
jgi:hypothetical protein